MRRVCCATWCFAQLLLPPAPFTPSPLDSWLAVVPTRDHFPDHPPTLCPGRPLHCFSSVDEVISGEGMEQVRLRGFEGARMRADAAGLERVLAAPRHELRAELWLRDWRWAVTSHMDHATPIAGGRRGQGLAPPRPLW